jgi:hypothetical protein
MGARTFSEKTLANFSNWAYIPPRKEKYDG